MAKKSKSKSKVARGKRRTAGGRFVPSSRGNETFFEELFEEGKGKGKKSKKTKKKKAKKSSKKASKKSSKKGGKKKSSKKSKKSKKASKKSKKAKKSKSRTATVVAKTTKRVGGKSRSVPTHLSITIKAPGHAAPRHKAKKGGKKKKKAKAGSKKSKKSKSKKSKKKGSKRQPKHMEMGGVTYEGGVAENPIFLSNPLKVGEFALAVVTGTLGFVGFTFLDRWLATTGKNDKLDPNKPAPLPNQIAVLAPMGWKRLVAGFVPPLALAGLAALPQLNDMGMARASLQGAALGWLFGAVGRVIDNWAMPKLLHDSDTGKRMYAAEIAAFDANKAANDAAAAAAKAKAAGGGTAAGFAGPRNAGQLGAGSPFAAAFGRSYKDGAMGASSLTNAGLPQQAVPVASTPMTPGVDTSTPPMAATPDVGTGCGNVADAVQAMAAQAYYQSNAMAAAQITDAVAKHNMGQRSGSGASGLADYTKDESNCGCATPGLAGLGMAPTNLFPDGD